MFFKKCSCIVFAKKRKVWDKKHFISKFLKEATNDYLLFVLDKCLFNGYSQASFTYHPVHRRK
jgi:hypothetical protein